MGDVHSPGEKASRGRDLAGSSRACQGCNFLLESWESFFFGKLCSSGGQVDLP